MNRGRYLDSWKEVASYLGRNVRTCRNWEQEFGLPVHRLDGAAKSHVFAYTGEIDAWRELRGRLPESGGTRTVGTRTLSGFPAPDVTAIAMLARALRAAAFVATLLIAIAATAIVTWRLRPDPKPPLGRFTIKLEPCLWLEAERPSRAAMAISSDGSFVVYSGIEANPEPQVKPRLFLRRMAQAEAKPIAGTEGGINPFLSPDDRWVGFWADGQLKRVLAAGGVPSPLCDLSPWFYGASWGRDGRIVFTDVYDSGLSIVPAEGGEPEVLTKPDPNREEYSHRLPFWLPDGKAVLFTVMRHAWDKRPQLALLSMDTREWRILLEDAANARYVPTGHLVFMRRGTLMAVGFDLARMEIVGRPVALVESVMQSFSDASYTHTGAGQFDISETGSLVYAAGGVPADSEQWLVWVDQNGIERPVIEKRLPYSFPRLSPDGRKIAYVTSGREWHVSVLDLDRGTNSPLTTDGTVLFSPVWSPDGKRLLFSWMRSLVTNLFWQPYDGGYPMERLTTSACFHCAGSWSPDGKTLALVELRPDTKFDIATLDVPSGRVTAFLNSPYDEGFPEFSPDGGWLAYTSNESKRDEVYVRAFPGPGIKQLVSGKGGEQPLWSRDGKQLFYRWENQVWAVDVRAEGGFATSKPRLLFEKPGYSSAYPLRDYDLSLDGRRFLMVKLEPREPEPVTELAIVKSWFEELKRLVPTGKK